MVTSLVGANAQAPDEEADRRHSREVCILHGTRYYLPCRAWASPRTNHASNRLRAPLPSKEPCSGKATTQREGKWKRRVIGAAGEATLQRHELLNWFVGELGYRRYAEIGIDNPNHCFNRVHCPEKSGVDPNVGRHDPPHHYRMTSDEFFRRNATPYDLFFIDGLHLAEQVVRDVENALAALTEGGAIVVHDCLPTREELATADRIPGRPWFGTVWKGYATLRATRRDIYMRCVPTDRGLGIITRGSQQLFTGRWATFGEFMARRDEILLPLLPECLPLQYGKH